MSTTEEIRKAADRRLRVTAYDRASSWMLSFLIFLGVVVLILLLIWLSNQIIVRRVAVPVQMADLGVGDGGGDGRPTGGTQLDTPDAQPTDGAADVTPVEAQDAMNMVTETVVSKTGQLDAQLDDPSVFIPKQKGWYGSGGGMGGGTGDGRGLGHGPGIGGGRPRRWELRFDKGNTLETYARQLDFFGIELAALMPENKVAYAMDLSKPKPGNRTGPADQEKRYYLTWRQGELQQADLDLLRKAAIDAKGRIVLKFLPPAVEAQLVQLEKERAGGDAVNVGKTVFGIRAADKGFAFYVIEQTYR